MINDKYTLGKILNEIEAIVSDDLFTEDDEMNLEDMIEACSDDKYTAKETADYIFNEFSKGFYIPKIQLEEILKKYW